MYFDTVKSKPANPKWSTKNEKDFINNLGKHSLRGVTFNTLAQRYLGAALRRTNWGDVDLFEIVSHVCGLLGFDSAETLAECGKINAAVIAQSKRY